MTGSDLARPPGQHRAAAQIDQGVRYTITQRLELLDPATGQPIPD
ncbi:hypothetical protein AB0L06_40540 [Spirillospora sp. NPDC052269]